MDFHLTKEQLLVQKMYREFAENEVKPLASEIDEEERFPMETVEKMGKLGMMGIYFPKEYGGAGGDVLSYAMCVEELAKVCGTTAVIVSAHTSLCAAPIFENGTEEQKMKYLPDLCSGKKIGAFGLTEPGAGTDAQGQQTVAVQRPRHIVSIIAAFSAGDNVRRARHHPDMYPILRHSHNSHAEYHYHCQQNRCCFLHESVHPSLPPVSDRVD